MMYNVFLFVPEAIFSFIEFLKEISHKVNVGVLYFDMVKMVSVFLLLYIKSKAESPHFTLVLEK